MLIFLQSSAFKPQLCPFTSDGCSASPNGIPKLQEQAWVDCCVEHDKKYWVGGTKEERLSADKALGLCIFKKGYPKIAELYFKSVRMGGVPYLPTTYRWGYGWNCLRPYGPLTDKEKIEILKMQIAGLDYNGKFEIKTILNPQNYYEANLLVCK
ncbi:MAG: FAD-binding oxidoreductase [Oligoflexia bacterium]|nr:FAD-binding oxidoreductase [Oligoflexia bacterium]